MSILILLCEWFEDNPEPRFVRPPEAVSTLTLVEEVMERQI